MYVILWEGLDRAIRGHRKREIAVNTTLFLPMKVDKGDNSCSREDRWENKCLEQLCRCIPHGAAESSRVTATAECTPGSTSTVISPLKNGGRGLCVCVCVCVCTEGKDSGRNWESYVSVVRRWGKRQKTEGACACVSFCLHIIQMYYNTSGGWELS